MKHVHNMTSQFSYLKALKQNLTGQKAIVHSDLSGKTTVQNTLMKYKQSILAEAVPKLRFTLLWYILYLRVK